MTAIAKVILPNPFFEVGSFVEVHEGDVQQIEVHYKDGRLAPGNYVGLVFPESLCRKYLLKILSKGFDDVGGHAEFRGTFKEKPGPTNTFWEKHCEEIGEDPEAPRDL